MLSDDKNINERVSGIINFIKNQGFEDKPIINTQASLIHYFIDRNSPLKALQLLTVLENDRNYKLYIANQVKIKDALILTRINLIKAKLATTKKLRAQFCLKTIESISVKVNTAQSVKITYPLVQAYTCLNRENEISEIKTSLVNLGITNFQL